MTFKLQGQEGFQEYTANLPYDILMGEKFDPIFLLDYESGKKTLEAIELVRKYMDFLIEEDIALLI